MFTKPEYFSPGRQAAAFTLGISTAATMVGLFLEWQIGKVDLSASLMCFVAVSAAILTPVMIIERLRLDLNKGTLFFGPLVVSSTLLLALAGLAGPIGRVSVVAIVLLSSLDVTIRRQTKHLNYTLGIFLIGLLFGSLSAIPIQGGGYLTVFSHEFLARGTAHVDTVMHLALAQMIRHQHVVSTGVDGVTPLTMYALAHALIGWLASLLKGETANVADKIYSIILFPLMLSSVLSGAIALNGGRGRLIIAATVVGTGMIIYPDYRSYFVSETYVVALFIFSSVLVPVVSGLALGMAQDQRSRAILAIAGLAGVSLATFGKASVGTLSAGLFGLAGWIDAWRRPTISQRLIWMVLSALAVSAVFIPSFLAVTGDIFSSVVGAEGGERPYYSELSWRALEKAFLVNSVTLLTIALLLLRSAPLWGGYRRNVLLLVIVVFAVVANAPGLSSTISLGQYYIINVQMWLSLSILAALSSAIVARSDNQSSIKRKEIAVVFTTAIVLAALLPSDSYITRGLKRIASARRSILSMQAEPNFQARQKLLAEIIAYRHRFGKGLRVYAPPAHKDFWTWTAHCEASSRIIPAVTGVPVVNGYPPLWRNCASGIKYRGWQVVVPRVSDEPLDDTAICALDSASGGSRVVYIIESIADLSRNRLINCDPRE
ncbi:hypothetical protein [Microvirga sp. TS319]|uniref:hypothetical protein n=1 Tax=Microvirga sp. TS319 TaxID=3241165 RepID=UPI00351A90D1